MSTAEYTAHNIYETYNLGALPQEVKRQLIIIFLNEPQEKKEDYHLDDVAELRRGAVEALDEIKAGLARPLDTFFEEVESEHPWLCK